MSQTPLRDKILTAIKRRLGYLLGDTLKNRIVDLEQLCKDFEAKVIERDERATELEEKIAKLQAELAHAGDRLHGFERSHEAFTADEAAKRIADLERQLAEAQVDAERWRWVKENISLSGFCYPTGVPILSWVWTLGTFAGHPNQDFTEAVDAAMAKAKAVAGPHNRRCRSITQDERTNTVVSEQWPVVGTDHRPTNTDP